MIAHPYGNATWEDLLGAIGTAAHRPLLEWGKQYILRPGMPVIEQNVDVANGKIRRLTLVQHPAQQLSGAGVWPMRTEVVLWSRGKQTQSIPVEIRAETTIVAAAAGRVAPDFVFANANDNAYGLVMLDDRSAAWLGAHIGDVPDTFLRAMLWGAMWDLVRDARLAPTQFIAAALRELPAEQDEQIASGIVTRLSRATSSYLSAGQQADLIGRVEDVLTAPRAHNAAGRQRTSHTPRFRADDHGNDATRGVARQRIDRRVAASPANTLVDRDAFDRARDAQRRCAVRRGNAPRHHREWQAKRVRRSGGPFVGSHEGPIFRSILPRHDAQRGLGHREPTRVQHGGSGGVDPALDDPTDRPPWIQKNRRIFLDQARRSSMGTNRREVRRDR
jgi:aminopeptidase N